MTVQGYFINTIKKWFFIWSLKNALATFSFNKLNPLIILIVLNFLEFKLQSPFYVEK